MSNCYDVLNYFAYSHLPEHLQQISRPFGELAQDLDSIFPLRDHPEVEAGYRKLLEAKDCFVRAALDL